MTEIINQLLTIFGKSAGMITLCILVLGLLFMLIEFFIPGFEICGILGVIISIGGVVYRICMGLNFIQIIILIVIDGFIILSCYLIFIYSIKKGLLSRSQLFDNEPSIPYDYEDNFKKKSLFGKIGITSTVCKPIGKAIIDGEEYDVLSQDSYLDKDTNIKVIGITDDNVVVSKI